MEQNNGVISILGGCIFWHGMGHRGIINEQTKQVIFGEVRIWFKTVDLIQVTS
jgi:hypothetical protein